MPTFKLDGKDIPFEQGDTIIRAAARQGIDIPHYCWHPGLSVAANCRMCLVEIKAERPMNMPILKWDGDKKAFVPDTKPKLAPACQQAAAEGMEVLCESSEVAQKAQKSTHEFLLLNHPVDCPICDQAGECKLQDYWFEHQGELKRKLTEPVHKPKAVPFGPTIVYDAERCVMCTRCIRFCDEVAKDHVLDMRERGNQNEIVVSPGRELDNDYTLMTEHVCPVGALTSKDFRFKARVWFLRTASSVCSGCATGCNMHVDFDPRDNTIKRLRPRDNAEVNQYWMCDDGMLSYKDMQQARLLKAQIRKGETFEQLSMEQALEHAAQVLKEAMPEKLGVVLSATHPTEDNFVLATLASKNFAAASLYLAANPDWKGDSILRHTDHNPNRAGAAQCVSGELKSSSALLSDIEAGRIETLIVLGSSIEQQGDELAPLAKLKTLINLSTHPGAFAAYSTVMIPVATHTEMHGSFVNAKGMLQHFAPAVKPPQDVEPAWLALVSLAQKMGISLDYAKFQDLNEAFIEARSPQQLSQESNV
ncbi:MAG: (2Fe-2S)-binding protein [Myxococcales bacterium]|nr:MAG: (2Fe-2S)-binding protein [Myxococcales bacterium]